MFSLKLDLWFNTEMLKYHSAIFAFQIWSIIVNISQLTEVISAISSTISFFLVESSDSLILMAKLNILRSLLSDKKLILKMKICIIFLWSDDMQLLNCCKKSSWYWICTLTENWYSWCRRETDSVIRNEAHLDWMMKWCDLETRYTDDSYTEIVTYIKI